MTDCRQRNKRFVVAISGQVEVMAHDEDEAIGKAIETDFNDDLGWTYDVERVR